MSDDIRPCGFPTASVFGGLILALITVGGLPSTAVAETCAATDVDAGCASGEGRSRAPVFSLLRSHRQEDNGLERSGGPRRGSAIRDRARQGLAWEAKSERPEGGHAGTPGDRDPAFPGRGGDGNTTDGQDG